MSTTVFDLRAELTGTAPSIPPFRMLLPEGWEAIRPGPQAEQQLLDAAAERLRREHRPDLLGQIRAYAKESFEAMRKQGAFVVLAPGAAAPDWAWLPASVIGTLLKSPDGGTLDRFVTEAIRERGARPLDEHRQIVTWHETRTLRPQGEPIGSTLLVHLIPVPGTGRTVAVQFTTSIVHPIDVGADDPAVARWRELLDAHLATFAWEPR